jgi:integrase
MPLTDTKVRSLRARDSVYRIADGNGLAIEVRPTGARLWRYRYRFNGRASMLGLGEYPAVSLADARTARDKARRLVDAGTNPAQARRDDARERRASADNTFKAVALEWIERTEGRWTSHHAADVRRSLEQEAFPAIGGRPVSSITPGEVIDCLRAIEKRDAIEVAHRTAQRIAAVFRYAVNTGRATFNPAADLRGVLKTRKVTHLKAMPRDDLPEFLRKLETYDGRPETRIGLRLLALTFVRTGELRGARWSEIDLDKAEWRIPAALHAVGRGDPRAASVHRPHATALSRPLESAQAGFRKHVPIRALPSRLSRPRDRARLPRISLDHTQRAWLAARCDRAPARARRTE